MQTLQDDQGFLGASSRALLSALYPSKSAPDLQVPHELSLPQSSSSIRSASPVCLWHTSQGALLSLLSSLVGTELCATHRTLMARPLDLHSQSSAQCPAHGEDWQFCTEQMNLKTKSTIPFLMEINYGHYSRKLLSFNTHKGITCQSYIYETKELRILCTFATYQNVFLRIKIAAVVVRSLSRVRLLATPWTATRQASLSFHYFPEFAQIHEHWVSDTIQLSHPFLPPSPPALNFSSIRVFSNESPLHIRWPKIKNRVS